MNLIEAIYERHSVRSYTDQPIEKEKVGILEEAIERVNKESGLNIQLMLNEMKAFQTLFAKYGKFKNVKNYFAIIGKDTPEMRERSGYFGEKLVLLAQQLGLNTCWVGLHHKKIKDAYEMKDGEKLLIVITLGYGEDSGTPHRGKSFEDVTDVEEPVPEWFRHGVEAALLAPTALNHQRFTFSLKENVVTAEAGLGFFARTDLGIVKYHFEIGAGKENFTWAED